jgi:hypothetical protein
MDEGTLVSIWPHLEGATRQCWKLCIIIILPCPYQEYANGKSYGSPWTTQRRLEANIQFIMP